MGVAEPSSYERVGESGCAKWQFADEGPGPAEEIGAGLTQIGMQSYGFLSKGKDVAASESSG